MPSILRSVWFNFDDPFHKTSRSPDKGAVDTLGLPVLQSISPVIP
jgi:hypothetical protein